MRKLLKHWISVFGLSWTAVSSGAPTEKTPKLANDKKKIMAEIPPPGETDTCFEPSERCDVKLIKFIESAKKTLDVAVYNLSMTAIVDALMQKSREVKVRVIVDEEKSEEGKSKVSQLVDRGVEVRFGTQEGHMHHKFTIVDGRRLQTGSFNYSKKSGRKNYENQVYLVDPQIVSKFVQEYEHIWQAARPARKSLGSSLFGPPAKERI